MSSRPSHRLSLSLNGASLLGARQRLFRMAWVLDFARVGRLNLSATRKRSVDEAGRLLYLWRHCHMGAFELTLLFERETI